MQQVRQGKLQGNTQTEQQNYLTLLISQFQMLVEQERAKVQRQRIVERENTVAYSSYALQQQNSLYGQQIKTLTTETQKMVDAVNQEVTAQKKVLLSAKQMMLKIRT